MPETEGGGGGEREVTGERNKKCMVYSQSKRFLLVAVESGDMAAFFEGVSQLVHGKDIGAGMTWRSGWDSTLVHSFRSW